MARSSGMRGAGTSTSRPAGCPGCSPQVISEPYLDLGDAEPVRAMSGLRRSKSISSTDWPVVVKAEGEVDRRGRLAVVARTRS